MTLENSKLSSATFKLVDHLFRHEYGRLVSVFSNRYGLDHIKTIEDSIQDAMIKAMQVWPYKNVPQNPSAWIFKVANNRFLDRIRRENKSTKFQFSEDQLNSYHPDVNSIDDPGFADDQLKMMFACCHPVLPADVQIMLTLNLLCGFGAVEISRALLKKKEATAKALTRGKARFKKDVGSLELPAKNEIRSRLQMVMKVIYLLFNEGYKTTQGRNLMDDSLTNEALRLGELLLLRYKDEKELSALMSLMCFHASRFKARTNEQGDLIPMKDQDRDLWDRDLIDQGHRYLESASESPYLTEYHIQAGIAALHCDAPSFEDTNWKQILQLYDLYVSHNRLPVAELNRVVPLYKVQGPEAGLKELDRLKKYSKLVNYHLYYAIKSELLAEMKEFESAVTSISKAIELASNESERRFLVAKRSDLKRSAT